MMARPCANAIATIPGMPTASPTTAAAPAPMNTNAKVPMNSARSLGAIRLDIVLSGDEINRWRDKARAKQQYVGLRGQPTAWEAPPAGEADGPTPRRRSA